MKEKPEGRLLQLTCAYGSMTTSLIKAMDDELYLMDVAEIQLIDTCKKLADADKKRLLCVRMNAEYIACTDDVFATVLIFFLLHELPPDERERSISEVIRVLRSGGRFVIAEHGACPKKHLLWRLPPTRYLLQRLEPFLESFWRADLLSMLDKNAQRQGKIIRQVDEFICFSGFYRACIFELAESTR